MKILRRCRSCGFEAYDESTLTLFNCNTLLGQAREDIEILKKSIEYLEQYTTV